MDTDINFGLLSINTGLFVDTKFNSLKANMDSDKSEYTKLLGLLGRARFFRSFNRSIRRILRKQASFTQHLLPWCVPDYKP